MIDTAPEMRLQALREGIMSVDAVLFTHAHADHLFGLDDTRRFSDVLQRSLPCYGMEETLDTVRRVFGYAFRPVQSGGGLPSLDLRATNGRFDIGGVTVTPIPVLHGAVNVLGYRIRDLAYITDCSKIPDDSWDLLSDLDLLVLGVLRPKPHVTHFCLEQGLEVVERLRPKQTLFTHISHRMEHESTNAGLPDSVRLAYDGLTVDV